MIVAIRRMVFSGISLASIWAAIYFSFLVQSPSYGMTGIWLAFTLVTFVIGWPEVAESISFFGNNIKLREVKNAINELKQLAGVISPAILDLYQAGNRWGGHSEDEKLTTYNSINQMLKSLGFSVQQIEKIQVRWHNWVERDYVRAIVFANSTIDHPEVPRENMKSWHEKREELKSTAFNMTPDQLRDLFREFNAYTQKVAKAIDDFEYYQLNKKQRDFEKWKQHSNWF